MENIKNLPETTVEATPPKELYAARASKSFQDFIKVLSQIIEKFKLKKKKKKISIEKSF